MSATFQTQDELEEKILKLEYRLAQIEKTERSQNNFLSFVYSMWPEFIAGKHHKIMAEKLERVANGELKRLIINMPPRHTKSEFASFLFPAWMIGKNPAMKIIQATHTTELAVNFGRKIKNLLEREDYLEIFPDAALSADSKASGRWDTARGGMYYGVGVGSNLAGRGGDLIIIDDPHSEQTAMSLNGFDDAWDWYTGGPRQRLQPGGAIIVVMCMTGETPVLRSDGTETALRDLRPGDEVATWEDGKLSASRINNWRSSGVDSVYTIRTRSGKIVRANERHPFLVQRGDKTEWIRLKHLSVGDKLVSLKGATGPQEPRLNRESVRPAKQKSRTIEKTLMRLISQLGITANGLEKFVQPRGAKNRCPARDCASIATENSTYLNALLKKPAQRGSSTATASRWNSMSKWWQSVATAVTSVTRSLVSPTLAHIGTANSVLTTATTQERSGVFSATIATFLSVTESAQKLLIAQPFTSDAIVSIDYDGEEEVFDVEVDRTENFIANGLVSHNTRWHEKDLTGQLIKAQGRDALADKWEVIEFPMELPSGNPVWPEFWSFEEMQAVKASIPQPKWNAQYQQNPTGDENAIIKREWWKIWDQPSVPQLHYVIQSYDTAFSKNTRSDYSAITTWGVFYPEEGGPPNLILLDAKKGRWEFPELKQVALDSYRFWDPETVIIEAKASGLPLTHELRNMGIPVVNFTPSRGNDKVSRVYAVSPLFESGMIWTPDESWAEEVVEECAAFPNGEHDDLVDSTTQALMRYRQGNFVQLPSDDWGDEDAHIKPMQYYG